MAAGAAAIAMPSLARQVTDRALLDDPNFKVIGVNPITVPDDFGGNHLQQTTLTPTFAWGADRSHDSGTMFWRQLQYQSNITDLTPLLNMADWLYDNNKSFMFTLFGTPHWAAETSPVNYQQFAGPYGAGLPDPAPCQDPTTKLAFAVNVMDTLTSDRMKWIELWNEPKFNNTYPPTTNDFWWGTAQQLVTECVPVAQAARDRGIVVCSPGFNDASAMTAFLLAVDPATGLRGADIIDTFNTHIYRGAAMPPDDFLFSTNGSITNCMTAMQAAGISKPILITEYGIGASNSDPNLVSFLSQSTSDRRLRIQRNFAIAAAYGIQNLFQYAYFTDFCGDEVGDTAGVILGSNIVQTLAGATLGLRGYNTATGVVSIKVNGVVKQW
jgi:hypothetical protein